MTVEDEDIDVLLERIGQVVEHSTVIADLTDEEHSTVIADLTDEELAATWKNAELDEDGHLKNEHLADEFWRRYSAADVDSLLWIAHNITEEGVCLPCSDKECHSCYGSHCNCECGGEKV